MILSLSFHLVRVQFNHFLATADRGDSTIDGLDDDVATLRAIIEFCFHFCFEFRVNNYLSVRLSCLNAVQR